MSSSTRKSLPVRRAIISLGSNSATSAFMLQAALGRLRKYFPSLIASTLLETEPIGLDNAALFSNQTVSIKTSWSRERLHDLFKEIEQDLGRDPKSICEVAIDIDLVQYGTQVVKSKELNYPHVKQGIEELLEKEEKMKFIGIIPARYASTRFPAKPLAKLGGKPVIQRVYEQVVDMVDAAYVATDDERIAEVVRGFGGKVVMTSPDHQSGTDRCYEAYQKVATPFDVIINIQGDEPFVQQEQIDSLKSCFINDETTDIATLIKPFTQKSSLTDLENSNSPKVVVGKEDKALYFSRSVVPYLRNYPKEEWLANHTFYKHIGLYAYRAEVLAEITALEQTPLELSESLEQLRWLENGYHIKVATTHIETIGIDTPEDLERAEAFLRTQTNK